MTELLTQLKKIGLIGLIFILFYFTIGRQQIDLSKADTVLGTIITSLGIIIAIVTTYLFSKIFSERNERIERKRQIDHYSRKLTSLRRLSHKMLTHSDIIWLNTSATDIHHHFPGLTLFKYRQCNYDQLREIGDKTKLGEILLQALLAAKWLEGANSTEYMLNPTYHKNYSLDEIAYYREASIFIYSFLNECQDRIKLENLNEYWVRGLEEEIQRINGTKNKLTIESLYLVFNDAYSDYLLRLHQLTQRNKKSVGLSFEGLFMNLVLATIITVLSVYALTFVTTDNTKIELIRISLCGLLTVIADMILNTFTATKKELDIEEFF